MTLRKEGVVVEIKRGDQLLKLQPDDRDPKRMGSPEIKIPGSTSV